MLPNRCGSVDVQRGADRRTWKPPWALIGVIASILVFVCAASSFALHVPAFHGTDERAHLGYAHAIADGRLPEIDDRPDIPAAATLWRDEVVDNSKTASFRTVWVANHPPLHYLLVTPLVWLSTGRSDGGLMFMRFANIAMASAGIVFTYLLTVRATGGQRRLGLAAASLVALLPRGHYEFSQGLNDGLAFAATTAAAWAAVGYLQLGHSRSRLLLLGATVAVAAGSRAGAMITAVAIVAVVSVMCLVNGAGSVRARAGAAALVAVGGLAPAIVLFGWFYLRNIRLYGDATASRYLLERFDRTRRRTPLAQFMTGTTWVRIYRQLPTKSLLPIRPSRSANLAADVAALLAAIGLVICVVTRLRPGAGRRRSCQATPSGLAVCVVVVVVVAATFAGHAAGGGSVTSRYVFPALGALAALFTIGLDRLTRWLPLVAVVTLAVWSAHVLPSRVVSDIERGGATPTSPSAATTAVLAGLAVASLVALVVALLVLTNNAAREERGRTSAQSRPRISS